MSPAATRRWIVIAALFSCSALGPTNAHAWPIDPTVNLPVATGPGPQSPTGIAPDGSGGAIIVWSDSSSANGYDVRATHVMANGTIDPAWPANGVAVCTAPGEQSSPFAVSDNAGGAIITWTDLRSGNYDIYAHHLLASGVTDPGWPANGAAVSSGVGDQFAAPGTVSHTPLIPDGSGGALTTWTDSRTGDTDIYVHRIRTSGVHPMWPVNGRAVCTATSLQQGPSLIPDGIGGAIVTWQDFRGPNADIYAHHVQLDGSLDGFGFWPVNGLAVCTAAGSQSYPEGVSDGFEGAIITWSDARSGTSDIYAHHVQSNGTVVPTLPTNGVPISTAPGTQARVRMVPDGSNGAFVSWYDYRDGVNEAVYAHHVTAACQADPAWPANGLAVRVATGDYFVGAASRRGFVSDGAGGAIVTWEDNRSGGWDVYAQRILPSGVVDPAWPVEGRAVSTAAGEQLGPMVAPIGNNQFMIAWFDFRNSTYDAYTQRVSRTGELGSVDFINAGLALPPLARGSLDWGDFDGDGDLDLLMTGVGGGVHTFVYANNGGVLTDVGAGLPGIEWSSAEWGDYDRDGDLDIAMAGLNGATALTRIYRNDSGVFVDITAGLPNVWAAAVAWGDYDGDGDLDLALAGQQQNGVRIARLCRNHLGSFTAMDVGFMGVANCDVDWGDYDLDGDLDIVIAGGADTGPMTTLYDNDGGTFQISATQNLTPVESMDGSLAWGDYDADGDLDLLISGWDQSNRHLAIFRNNGGDLNDIDANLPGLSSSAVAWGDYDNDGDLDILASGYWGGGTNGLTRVYRNNGGTFVDAEAGLPSLYWGAVAWADYDNDGDLDVTLQGTNGTNTFTFLYEVDGPSPNAPPAPPTNLTTMVSGGVATFTWTAPADDNTPSSGLTYNLRVGSASGANSIVPSMSGANGYRWIVRNGNVGSRVTREVEVGPGPFYWTVQAVDGAFAGSVFANEMVLAVEGEVALGPPGIQAARPNPFRTSAEILFNQPRTGRVDLSIYDLGGRRVRVLERGERPAGSHRVTWDGCTNTGERLRSGLYWVRLETEAGTSSYKVVLTE